MRPSPARYHSTVIALHWLMLVLIAAVYTCIQLHEFFPKGSALRDGLKTWHFMLGLSVGALVVVRIGLRLATETPPITPTPPGWQQWLAKAMALALYGLMIAMPLLGWLILSASGKPVPFFGLQLPALMGENKAFARQLMEIHETLGFTGYGLIALHAAAGLLHHYKLRDDTLKRMLPWS